MIDGVDIGALTGQIKLDDTLSSGLELAARKIEQFGQKFEGAFGQAVIGASAAVAAIGAVTAAVVALGIKGAEVNDVQEGFETLAGSVKNADAIMAKMREGTLGTINNLQLMSFANKSLATGAIKTAEDFGTLTSAAKILSDRFGGDLTDSMNSIQRAMVTGQTRGLGMQGVVVDLGEAEKKYATSLGTTADQLTHSQKLVADRAAIMESLNKTVKEAGPLQADFGEKLEAAGVAIQNWGLNLAKAVASSPHVTAAVDAIGKAFNQAFGGEGKTLMDGIVSMIDSFADKVARYAPPIIKFFGDAWDWLVKWHGTIINVAEALAIMGIVQWAGTAVRSFGLVAGAIDGIVVSIKTANFALASSPIGLLSLAAGAGFLAAKQQSDAWIAEHEKQAQLLKDQALIQEMFSSKVALTAEQTKQLADAMERVNKATKLGTSEIPKLAGDFGGLKVTLEDAKKGLVEVGGAQKIVFKDLLKFMEESADLRDKGLVEARDYWNQRALKGLEEFGKNLLDARKEQDQWDLNWKQKSLSSYDYQMVLIARWAAEQDAAYRKMFGVNDLYYSEQAKLVAEVTKRVQDLNAETAKSTSLKQWNDFVAATGHAPGVKGTATSVSDTNQAFAGLESSMKAVNLLFSAMGQTATGSMREVDAAISTATNLVMSYAQSMLTAKTESQKAAAASSLAWSAASMGVTFVIGAWAAAHQRAVQLRADIADLQSQIQKLGGTPVAFGMPAQIGISLEPGRIQQKILQAQLDALQKAADEAAARMGRLGLTADDLKTPLQRAGEAAVQLGKDLSEIGRNKNVDEIAKKLAGPLNDALRYALETGTKLDPSMRPYLEALAKAGLLQDDLARKILGLPAPDTTPWEEMKRVGEEYGLTEDQLGEKFRNAKLISGAEELAKNWELLVGNGADVGAVMDKMKEQANGFLNNAKKWGLEVPESMKPMLQAMLDAGELTDENGKKLDTLDDVNWGKSIQSAIGDLISKLGEFFDKLKDPPTMHIQTYYDLPEGYVPGTFGPGAGLGTPGTGVPVPVPPPTGAHVGAGGVGGSTHPNSTVITIQALDGASFDGWLRRGGDRKIAEAVANVSRSL